MRLWNALRDGNVWKSLLYDASFVLGSFALSQIDADRGLLILIVGAYAALYTFLKWSIWGLFLRPRGRAWQFGLESGAIYLIILGALSGAYALSRAVVQEAYVKGYVFVLGVLILFFGYVTLQAFQAGNVIRKPRIQTWKKALGALLPSMGIELLSLGALYGVYALFFRLLPWRGINILFQVVTAVLLYSFNAANRKIVAEAA